MTDGERIATALLLSLVLHWAVLMGGKTDAPSLSAVTSDSDIMDVVDFSGPEVGISLAAPITIEQAPAPPQASTAPDDAVADRRREALAHYLDLLSASVHMRRGLAGEGSHLIGNALVHIVIDKNGRFSDIALARGSENVRLDADALNAVRAASGTVPRPRILGNAPIAITLAVKYQFGL